MSAARDPHALTSRFRHPVHSRRGTVAHNQLLQTRGQRLSTSSEGLGMDKTALQLSGGKATCHSLLVWQEYWSRLPFPSLGDLPGPGIEPMSSALKADSLPLSQ